MTTPSRLPKDVAPIEYALHTVENVEDVASSGRLGPARAQARDHAETLLADIAQYSGGTYFARIVALSASAATANELEAFGKARLASGELARVSVVNAEIRERARLQSRLLLQLEAEPAER